MHVHPVTAFKAQHGDAQLERVLAFATSVLAERPDTDWAELTDIVTLLFPKVLLPRSRKERDWFFMALRHGVVANLVITADPKARERERWTMKTYAGAPLELSIVMAAAAAAA